MPEGIAILWLPNGVLLAYLLWFDARYVPVFLGLGFMAEIVADLSTFTATESVIFGVVNLAEVLIARVLLSRWLFSPNFSAASDVAKFILSGPIIAAGTAAACGALVYSTFRGGQTTYVDFVRVWWSGDALGLMITTPLLLSLWSGRSATTGMRAGAVDLVLGACGVVTLALVLSSTNGSLAGVHVGPVLLLPFVIYASSKFGFRTAAIAVTVVALVVIVLTAGGRNPFGHSSSRDALIHAQEFVFITGVMALGLGALLSHIRAAEAEVMLLNVGLEERVRVRTRELESALAEMKQLKGLLPVCAWCRKIRDDEHYWHSLEEYVERYTDATISHGICPICAAQASKELDRA